MSAPAQAHPTPDRGLAPAFAAVRVRLGLVAVLFALAGVGWWWTARQMQGMDEGPWTGLGALVWFLGVWVVMMAAMMFPSVAPTIALYSRMTRKRAPVSPLLFAMGYLVVWAGAGVVADSDPVTEEAETRHKARAVLSAIATAEGMRELP